jgi:phosphoserine phosphatase RsbX
MDAVIERGDFDLGGQGLALAWAVAHRPKTKDAPSGDGFLARWIGDFILFAVVDGAGNGPEAAQASAKCLRALEEADSVSPQALFDQAHRACLGTRGTALAITLIDPSIRQITWAAVGDVEGLLLRRSTSTPCRREAIIQRGGIVGYNLPAVINQSHEMEIGDTIIMSTDGIRNAFRSDIKFCKSAKTLASDILHVYGRDNDDALVLIAGLDSLSCPTL